MSRTPAPCGTCNGSCFLGLEELQGSCALWGLLGALALFYLLSLVCNVLCCLRYKKVRDKLRSHVTRLRGSAAHLAEEVPVYGNIGYLQSGHGSGVHTVKTESEREPRVKKPTCYANLKLKSPGRLLPEAPAGSTEIQYTDVVLAGPRCSELEVWAEGCVAGREAAQPPGELYASVHTDRFLPAFENQDYANNHAVPS
ncbi:signaling threshold-regulating transmembrane adapter 1 isoform X5 [Alligator mississippiensis]|uniref:signaling threshold-regulating transmembrane adapter 1 isoform X5 n=1 Tax=Alligator mississippiensis TaxID=8496 RepID=UPI0028775D44|nr:signaling threshold-regulating transmembrane adapter 1 isoform X5 [Alligator mississippiensis]XP_059571329.1 signaling threshold-regulating transmembrane adapter 1 isoform X5 [Alligator mississippiensis]